jgi:hypothetical protein
MRQTSFPEAGISSSQLAHGPPRFDEQKAEILERTLKSVWICEWLTVAVSPAKSPTQPQPTSMRGYVRLV